MKREEESRNVRYARAPSGVFLPTCRRPRLRLCIENSRFTFFRGSWKVE